MAKKNLKKNFIRKVVVLGLSICAIILLVLLYLFYINSENRIRELEIGLSDVSLPVVKVGTSKYTLKNGHIEGKIGFLERLNAMNLLAFYQWNKEDPLFYSPDLNIGEFDIPFNRIEYNQQKLLSEIKNNRHIYPTDFLKSFGQTVVLSKTFFQNPTSDNAKKLILQQLQTSSLYKKEIQALSSIIIKGNNDPSRITKAIVLVMIELNIKTTISDLKKIETNADILIKEILAREKCFKGEGACNRPSRTFEKPIESLSENNISAAKLLDKNLMFALESKSKNFDVEGPYGAKTPCFGWEGDVSNPEQYFYFRNDPSQIDIRLASEIYFKKLTDSSAISSEQTLYKEGVKYSIIPSSTLYMCPYDGYLAEISEMHLFLKKNRPMLQSLKVENSDHNLSFFNKSKDVEEKVFKSKYHSYDDLKVLSLYYGYIYKLVSENKTLLADNNDLKDELLRRKIVIDKKLGDFYKILNYAAQTIKYSTKINWKATATIAVSEFVYPYRSFYGIMYLPFSPAVYRSNEKLQYIEERPVINSVVLDGDYMSYSQAKVKYSNSEILRWITQ